MKKFTFCFILSLFSLSLIGCGSSSDVDKEAIKSNSTKQDFEMKEKCAKYKNTWKGDISEDWADYDAYSSCEIRTYYSENLNTCIGESICNAGGMYFYTIVDILENTKLYSCSEVEDECQNTLQQAHISYQ